MFSTQGIDLTTDRASDQAILALAGWFERQKRVLPWREDPSPYRVWISEIMLQQTQVVTVRPFFERFLARFPHLEDLASAPESEVVAAWAGLGYYSRARNLHRAAQILARDGFPRDRAGWVALPGVGDYTAGAILSIAFDQPEAIVDGNVERVLSRIRTMRRQGSESRYKARLWRASRFIVESGFKLGARPSALNQALMELGAVVCTPRSPKCGVCPVAGVCRARESVEAFPEKKAPKVWKAVSERVVALRDGRGRWLLRLRRPGEWRAGLWDFPEPQEIPAEFGLDLGECSGEVEARYVVTRHKVSRRVAVHLESQSRPDWTAAEACAGGSEWLWWDPAAPSAQVGQGSAFKRSLQRIQERWSTAT